MSKHSNSDILLSKLDAFIRKYYLNQLIRGCISGAALLLGAFVVAVLSEYFGHFGTGLRTALFYSLLGAAALVLRFWVARPLMGLYRLGSVMSHDEAARVVGRHFGILGDKVLNTLQLQRMAQSGQVSELLLAGIDQRTAELRPIPFPEAIDLSKNTRLLRYALPPTLLLLGILAIRPGILLDGSRRIMAHRTEFLPVAPFTFDILNDELTAAQGEDFLLSLAIVGNDVPAEVYVEVDGSRYLMTSSGNAHSFTFRNVSQSQDFRFYAGGFHSAAERLEVLARPSIAALTIDLDFPSYLGMKDERLSNTGDLVVPEGTRITWNIEAVTADEIRFVTDTITPFRGSVGGRFSHTVRPRSDLAYALVARSGASPLTDTVRYRIQIVPDLAPSISVEEAKDTSGSQRLFFRGTVKDDHGFSALRFMYRLVDEADTAKWFLVPIGLPSGTSGANYYHSWDVSQLAVRPGESIEYLFEIWDNDGVNGAKSARTQRQVYRLATLAEKSEENQERNDAMQKQLRSAISEAHDIKKEMTALQQQMLEKKSLDWQDRQRIEQLLERQKELEKDVSDLNRKNENRMDRMTESFEMDERLMEKQAQLQELFNELLTDEMKAIYEKMQKMLEELNKDKLQEALENMKFNAEDLEKELDRSLELFKQLEFEQKLNETKERLEDLAKRQDELADKTSKSEKEQDGLEKEQEKLSEEFKELGKELEDLKKKNEELEKPKSMDELGEQQKDVQKEQQQSEQNLGQKQNKKAAQNQKKAAEKMNDMAKQMGNMMAQMQQEGQEEDMNSLRQILENLLTLSFDQEKAIKDLKSLNRNDPRYVDVAREQRRLKDDSKLIEDSLFALSKRVEQIKTVVNREIRQVNQDMGKALDEMGNRNTPVILSRQQGALTSINNLALLLSEALQQMQQSAANSSGSGSCSKPGSKPGQGKNPSAASMRQMQEQLNKQMDAMQKALEKGQKDGGIKPGQRSGQGGMPGMSKELAQMAAQQEALRNMVREYEGKMKQGDKGGKNGAGGLGDLSQKMEQTERDIVNKNITAETLRRQQEILSKLLEAEKSEREREMENRRESHEAKDENSSNPEEFFKYKPSKRTETELLLTVPADLSPFYRNKVDEYLLKSAE